MRKALFTSWVALIVGGPLFVPSAFAQAESPLRLLREEERWEKANAEMPAYKHMELGAGGPILSVGMDARFQIKALNDEGWGAFPGANDAIYTRLMGHANLAWGDRARAFVALKYGDVIGSDFPAPSIEQSQLELHQAFAEIGFGDALGASAGDATVRIGRQELNYGAGRLIAFRQGPNIRLSHDGAALRLRNANWRMDIFAVHPVRTRLGAFDDEPNTDETLWGLYATRQEGASALDLYLIGYRRPRARFVAADGKEERQSIGTRYAFRGARFTGDIETTFQVGALKATAETFDIHAWSLAGSAAYVLEPGGWRPTLGVQFGVTSGGGSNGAIGTFRAPNPPGRYFGPSNRLGPGNLNGFQPFLAVHPHRNVTLTAQSEFFWRTDRADGLYTPTGAILRSGSVQDRRFVGVEYLVSAEWRATPNISWAATVARFETGPFLETRRPDRDVNYGALQIELRY